MKKPTAAKCCVPPTLLTMATRKSSSTDEVVVVQAVALACTLKEETEVWVSFGTRKAFCFLAHEIARALGPEKSQVLPRLRHRHGLLLCRTWREDSMGSVDSST